MGWTCQYDVKGFCKRLRTPCVPGIKGCILQTHDGIVFSSPPPRNDEEKRQEEPQERIDFSAAAKSF